MGTPLALFERIRFEFPTEILCVRCHTSLDRHQPDPDRPERLLGTCYHCGAWYYIDDAAGVIVTLPDMESLRES